jgi:hypothetical protein
MVQLDNLEYEGEGKWYDDKPQKEIPKHDEKVIESCNNEPIKRWENEKEHRIISRKRDVLRSDLRDVMMWSCTNGYDISTHIRRFFGCYCNDPYEFFKRAEREVDEVTTYAISLIKYEKDASSEQWISYLDRKACDTMSDFAQRVGYPHQLQCFERIQ